MADSKEGEPISQIQITLNVGSTGVSLNDVKSIDTGEGKFEEAKRIAPNTSADAIAGMISGLDEQILKKFSAAYTSSASSETTQSPDILKPNSTPKDLNYYVNKLSKQPEDLPTYDVLGFIEGVLKKIKLNDPQIEVKKKLYMQLYDEIKKGSTNNTKFDWKSVVIDGRSALKILRIIRAHETSISKISGYGGNSLVQRVDLAFKNLLNDKKQKIPKIFRDALISMQEAINKMENFYYPTPPTPPTPPTTPEPPAYLDEDNVDKIIDYSDTISESKVDYSKIKNFAKSNKALARGNEFVNLYNNLPTIIFGPGRDINGTPFKKYEDETYEPHRQLGSGITGSDAWIILDKDEYKVKSFLEELLKYRNFASISRATSATKRIVGNLLGKKTKEGGKKRTRKNQPLK